MAKKITKKDNVTSLADHKAKECQTHFQTSFDYANSILDEIGHNMENDDYEHWGAICMRLFTHIGFELGRVGWEIDELKAKLDEYIDAKAAEEETA